MKTRPARANGLADSASLQHIATLIEAGGQVTLGHVHPVPCAAVASQGRRMLAGLVRRDGETLVDLLLRLDTALDHALHENAITNEISAQLKLQR